MLNSLTRIISSPIAPVLDNTPVTKMSDELMAQATNALLANILNNNTAPVPVMVTGGSGDDPVITLLHSTPSANHNTIL